ncbi:MAG: response regulator transcription factor [Chloroflexota bacterium]|nr:response regulator transcription factor [Chloroflexota bacterium]
MDRQGRLRIMLVEDHGVVRAGLKALLNNEPDMTVVAEAGTGPEALALLHQNDLDLAVVDLTLPEMSGVELIERLHQEQPALQVVVLTMHGGSEYVRQVMALGIDGYVLKKAADVELLAAIRTAAAGGVFLHPEVARMVRDDYARGRGRARNRLSDQEREVLRLTALGFTVSQAAEQLALSPKTVETYRTRVMQKLGIDDRAELVAFALQSGLLDTPPE